MTKANLSKIEAIQKQKYVESKLDLIPASLRNVYSSIGGKDTLVARELFIDDKLVLGIEYSPEGAVAGAYTTDTKGNRIYMENTQAQEEKASAPKDLISRKLDEVAKNLVKDEPTLSHDEKPVEKKIAKRPLDTRDAALYAAKQRNGHSA